MKKLGIFVLLLLCNGCALEVKDKIESTLDDIQTSLDDLNTSECIRVCTDTAEICLDYANGQCVDNCQADRNECDTAVDSCMDTQSASCDLYTGAQYTDCLVSAQDYCDGDCENKEKDCG